MSEAETIWGVGDYPLMAERLEDAARRAIARADVTTDDRVLDIACGTGNAALAAAPLAGSVAGVDFEPALLNVARSRSKDVGATVDWMVGDALALPFEDGAFDVVLSVFGIMYAADQAAAAAELERILAPGGRAVLASWSSGGFMPAMRATLAPFLPSDPAAPWPPTWGDVDSVTALLAAAGLSGLRHEAAHLSLRFPDTETAVAFLIRTAGQLMLTRPLLEADGRWPAVVAGLTELVDARSESVDRGLSLRQDYLLTVVRRRGQGRLPTRTRPCALTGSCAHSATVC